MKEIIFPKDLYADIRIENRYNIWLQIQNGEIESDGDSDESGAMIRVFDGNLWYTSSTNDLEHLQEELDRLAELAVPNEKIDEHPVVKKYEVHRDEVLHFEGDKCVKNISRDPFLELLNGYIDQVVDDTIPQISFWVTAVSGNYVKKTFLSSKGAHIVTDMQELRLIAAFGITIDGITNYASSSFVKKYFEELTGHEETILEDKSRMLDYAKNAVDVEAGEYTCILSPITTAMFTHECFGHKSESDFMLSDKTLQEEWVMGKTVGGERISICDDGNMFLHGYVPYDDEGTKARETWLIKDGILTGRLHDANSADVLSEELTGNSRAQDYTQTPVVRMTNTYMAGGTDRLEDMFTGVKDGIYIYKVNSGTGQSTFTMRPLISYRIRDGKICEPVRVNVVNGSVFKALFDIDMIGDDFEMFDCYYCGKMGQTVIVSAGGPSIRVKSLTVN